MSEYLTIYLDDHVREQTDLHSVAEYGATIEIEYDPLYAVQDEYNTPLGTSRIETIWGFDIEDIFVSYNDQDGGIVREEHITDEELFALISHDEILELIINKET